MKLPKQSEKKPKLRCEVDILTHLIRKTWGENYCGYCGKKLIIEDKTNEIKKGRHYDRTS